MQDIERARRRIKLRDLHILLVISQRGSMAKAAAELAMSQPAISRAVADMEQALGVRLFDRCRSGIELTAYGAALVRRGVSIFDELTQGLQELEFLADPSVGELRVGSTESIAAGLLPVAIDRFTRQHPGIRINVAQTVLSDLRYRELRERTIDLLLGWTPTPFNEKDLAVEPLLHDPRVVVAGRRSKLAHASKLQLADLVKARWVLPPPDTFPGTAVADMLRCGGIPTPDAPIATLSLHLCCRLAATGRFVTVLPGSVAQWAGADLGLKILPVQLPRTAAVSAAIVTLKGRTLRPSAERFIACIREVAKIAASKTGART
ncbi:DNA-binding transcriptional LysR family regulator [Bradyrhizobium sp. USDA 4011]